MGEHEQHEVEDAGDMIDYISNLHDSILEHILSFLSTKQVVKTSVLSTRWNNLWASVPNIDFDNKWLRDRKVDGVVTSSFMNFLERVLGSRGASNIKKFRLLCPGSYEESQTHSWISDAIAHNAQELDLILLRPDPSMIPWSMFDRTSLVSLKIMTHYCSGELPSCISFPCLKTLHIRSFVFPNDAHVEKLLLGCPVLEDLSLLNIWKNLKNIVISNSTLKTLTIDDVAPFQPWYDPTCAIKIKIDAPNLTYFSYTAYLSNEILLNNVSSLVKARICIVRDRKKEVVCGVIGLFKRLQYVVSLTFSGWTMESIADNNVVRCMVFPNLRHLKLTMGLANDTFRISMNFLSSCPVLQSICFSWVDFSLFQNQNIIRNDHDINTRCPVNGVQGFWRDMQLGENDSIWSSIPICMTNCLKRVTFKKFLAYDSEVCFLKCILKYACVLERMDIRWSKVQLGDLKKTEVRKEFETISTACVVKFS